MMVAPEHNLGRNLAAAYGFVECQRDACTSESVSVKDACLRTNHKVVFASLAYPVKVVGELRTYVVRRVFGHLPEHLGGNPVGCLKVLGIAGGAHPAEGAETVIEEFRSHYILHI